MDLLRLNVKNTSVGVIWKLILDYYLYIYYIFVILLTLVMYQRTVWNSFQCAILILPCKRRRTGGESYLVHHPDVKGGVVSDPTSDGTDRTQTSHYDSPSSPILDFVRHLQWSSRVPEI